MGYTAFGIELDDEGYPEWHRNRKQYDMDNPIPLHSINEYKKTVRSIESMNCQKVSLVYKESSQDVIERIYMQARINLFMETHFKLK